MKKIISTAFSLLAIHGLVSCSSESGSGGTQVKTEFKNNTGGSSAKLSTRSLAANEDATTFQVKLISVYLAEDIDSMTFNNVGQTSMIFLNNDCQDDIMHCDISAGVAEDSAPMDKIISSYFDFALPTEQVNAALNAQNRAVTPGTYKYARIEFCKYNTGMVDNVKWGSASVTPAEEYRAGACTANSAVFDPPLTIADGDTVTVTLSYNLTGVVESSTALGDNCANGFCLNLPTFTPSATVQ